MNDSRRYDLASLAWMAFLAVLASAIWLFIIPRLVSSGADANGALNARDDAQAMIARFGSPEVDSAAGSQTTPTVRMLTYRERRLRVAFVRHATRHMAPTWKLSRFLDLDRDSAVDDGEALKRLNNVWR